MTDSYIKIDTRLDNSKIQGDLNELEKMVESGAENITDEFAQKVDKLSSTWQKLEAQQEKNNLKVKEYKSAIEELSWVSQSLNRPDTQQQYTKALNDLDLLKVKLTEAEANAKGIEVAMSKVGLDSNKLKDNMTQTNNEAKGAESSTSKMGNGINKGLRSLLRYASALVGIRAAYSAIQRASNAWLNNTEEGQRLAQELQGMWLSLGQTLSPIISWLIGGLKTLLGYANAITKAFFGFELFSSKGVKNLKAAVGQAKELRKQSAGFDEFSTLGSNGQQNLSGGIGGGIDFKIDTPDISWLEKLRPLIDALKASFQILFEIIKTIATWIWDNFIKGLQVIAEWVSKNEELAKVLAVALGILLGAFVAFKILSAASWVVIAIAGIITAIGWLSDNWETVVAIFNATIDEIKLWFKGLGDLIKWVWDHTIGALISLIGSFIKFWIDSWNSAYRWWFDVCNAIYKKWLEIWDGITGVVKTVLGVIAGFWSGIFTGMLKTAGDIIGNIKGVFSGLITFLTGVFTGNWKKAWDGIVKIFENVIGGIANVFKAPFNIIIEGINGFIRAVNKIKVPDWVPSWLGGGRGFNIPTIPRLARGGIVSGATTAMIGEAGREAVIPLQNNTDWASDFLNVLDAHGGWNNGSQGTQTINLVVDGKVLATIVNSANKDSDFAMNGGFVYG